MASTTNSNFDFDATEDAVDSVWISLRAEDETQALIDQMEIEDEARRKAHEDGLIETLQRDMAEKGHATLIMGKRHVDFYDPMYDRVKREVPGVEIISEYELYARDGLMG